MEVLNDVLAQARLSRIGRGEPQKMKGCLGGRCSLRAASRHPLNSCNAEELSASCVNRPSVRRQQPARPKKLPSRPSRAQQRRLSRGDRSQQARCLWSRSWRRLWRPSNPAWSSLLWLNGNSHLWMYRREVCRSRTDSCPTTVFGPIGAKMPRQIRCSLVSS